MTAGLLRMSRRLPRGLWALCLGHKNGPSCLRWAKASDPLRQAFAFLLFRIFDIAKPPPIRQVDAALKNGVGVMVDDLLAAAYTLFVFALVVRLVGNGQ